MVFRALTQPLVYLLGKNTGQRNGREEELILSYSVRVQSVRHSRADVSQECLSVRVQSVHHSMAGMSQESHSVKVQSVIAGLVCHRSVRQIFTLQPQ